MKFLKGLALGLLSFLLFLSLSLFGLALTLNMTVLNADFVNSQLDRLDISAIARDAINEEIDELPEGFRISLENAIPLIEQRLKEAASTAIDSIYDYLLGETQNLDLALILRNTIFNPDLTISLLEDLDLAPLAEELLRANISEQIPDEVADEYLAEYIDEVLAKTVAELEPWIKEQVAAAIPPIYDYLLGESQSFNIEIPLEPVIESLRVNLKAAFLESPPELIDIPPAVLEQYFDELWQEFTQEMPSTFNIDEGSMDSAPIVQALAAAEQALTEARTYIGYFQTAFIILIILMPLTVLGIILINRQVRSATRELGIIFLAYGAIEYIGILVTKSLAGRQLSQLDIPPLLQSWLPPLLDDFLVPLQIFSLGLLVAGIALIIVSIVYKPRPPSF